MPLPGSLSIAAGSAPPEVIYERSAWSGAVSFSDSQGAPYQIIGGASIPQSGNLSIFDTLAGTPLVVGSGNDVIIDTVSGQTIRLGTGNDSVFTYGGVNLLYIGMGSDLLVGDGSDVLDYANITGSVSVDLSAGAAKKSNGGTDYFNGIQVVIGSPANDAITGNGANDVLAGGGGVITPAVVTAYTPAGAIGANWTIIGAKDASGDGKADYLWANAGKIALWTISNGVLTSAGLAGGAIGSDWTAKTTGDFNRDGFADVLWVNTGRVAVWELQGAAIIGGGVSNGQIGSNFSFKTLGDFNHDGDSDVLWQSNTGQVAVWLMQGSNIAGGGLTNAAIGTNWTAGGTGDFNGDGRDDVVWFNSSGQAVTWLMNGTAVTSAAISGTIGGGFKVGGIADMNMDGKADIVWWNPTNNAVAIWYMNGTQVAGATIVSNGGQIGTDWKLSGVGDVTGDGIADVVWTRPNGSSVIWNLRGNGDMLIGSAGRDTFQLNTLSEMGEVISNFRPGAGQDVLDLHNLLTSIGHGASDAFVDGTVRLIQDGTAVEVEVDTSPGEHHYVRAASLQNVAASTLVPGNFQLSAAAGGQAGVAEQTGDFAIAGSPSTSDSGAQVAAASSTSQLVQAMAGFGGAGAADGMNSAFGAQALQQQQQLLTIPQHA
jgi:VCBS repeat protein